MEEYMLPCLNKKVFGLDCPGCGTQRAFSLVIQGKFAEAFDLYPAIFPLLILLFFLVINLFFKFKYQHYVRIGLISLTGAVIIGSYLYKLSFLIH